VIDTVLILLGALLVVDITFVIIRAAFIHSRMPRLVNLRESSQRQVDLALNLLERPHFAATLRIGVATTHILLGATGLAVLLLLAGVLRWGVELLLLLVVVVVVLVVEFFAERLVFKRTERWALALAPLAWLMDLLFRPLSWLLMGVLGTAPAGMGRSMAMVTDDELKNWVEDDAPESTLEQGERQMIYSIFHFSDTLCREVMVPRIDVSALEVSASVTVAIAEVARSGHSRLPIYEETIDNVVGLLYAKDLLGIALNCDQNTSLRGVMRPAFFVPEAKKVEELLREMRERGTHIAVVVDEYGGMAGIVTLEDIVEEIVGEIRDEYDQSEELLFQKVSDDEFLLQGRIDLDDVNELLDTQLTKDNADTLGGLIYGEIGHIPAEGEQVTIEGWALRVEHVRGRRIHMVHATRQPETDLEESHDDKS
jgi:putative hemolysin